jgi:hypothetical protein
MNLDFLSIQMYPGSVGQFTDAHAGSDGFGTGEDYLVIVATPQRVL